MDQGRGLEGVVVLFTGQPVCGQPSEFIVDEREQLRRRAWVAMGSSVEQDGYVGQAFAICRKPSTASSFPFDRPSVNGE
jgi:hypothetical protein